MINQTITESDKMRIVDYQCRILLGERFGIPMYHESSRVYYIPLRPGYPNYFAEFDKERQIWLLTDSNNSRLGEFQAKSSMTRWVRKRIA